MPGVLRSNSPFSFGGRRAGRPDHGPHPPDAPHGLNSPIGRVYELDGQVLLLGIDHTANTTIHLAESLSGVRYRRKKYVTLPRTASRRALTTARSTTAVRTLPWWMAGWTPGVCSAWEPWDARGRAGPLAGRGGGGDRAAAPG